MVEYGMTLRVAAPARLPDKALHGFRDQKRGRACDHTVEVTRVTLRLGHGLASAIRASLEIGVHGSVAVIGGDHALGRHGKHVRRAICEVAAHLLAAQRPNPVPTDVPGILKSDRKGSTKGRARVAAGCQETCNETAVAAAAPLQIAVAIAMGGQAELELNVG